MGVGNILTSRAYNPGHILQSRDFGIDDSFESRDSGIPGLTFFKSRDPGISGLGKEYPLVLNPRGFNVII